MGKGKYGTSGSGRYGVRNGFVSGPKSGSAVPNNTPTVNQLARQVFSHKPPKSGGRGTISNVKNGRAGRSPTRQAGRGLQFAKQQVISRSPIHPVNQYRRALSFTRGSTGGGRAKAVGLTIRHFANRGAGGLKGSMRAGGFGRTALIGATAGGVSGLAYKQVMKRNNVTPRKQAKARRLSKKSNKPASKSQLKNGKQGKKPSFARRHIRVRRDGKGRFAGSY